MVYSIVATFLALSSGCSKAQGEATYAALSRKTSRVSGSAAVIVANCLTRAVSNLQGQTIHDARAKDTWERKACVRQWCKSYA